MKKVAFDYSKLRGRIIEKYGMNKVFAEAINVSPATLSQKLNNRRFFNQAEIYTAAQVLEIEPGTVASYFFTPILNKT